MTRLTGIPPIDQPSPLLGGLTPTAFMRDYWQKKPLLVRQAIPHFVPPLSIGEIRRLARRDEVESRLVKQTPAGWKLRNGPFQRLPDRAQANWTLLVQGVDLHDDDTAALMHRFRFIGDARLDDAMISIAGDGGGVGPHYDSYDVFLLQGAGRRRWRTSQQADLALLPDAPLKILTHFQPDTDDVLEPGDLLYLPPQVCHEGVALGADCMTISIGFRAPSQALLARGLLEAAADQVSARYLDDPGLYGEPPLAMDDLSARYRDVHANATRQPAQLPDALVQAALDALQKVRLDAAVARRFLGQWLSELPENAFFDPGDASIRLAEAVPAHGQLTLDRCTRLLYCGETLFINGEVARQAADATFKALADARGLSADQVRALPAATRAVLDEWLAEGWAHWEPAP